MGTQFAESEQARFKWVANDGDDDDINNNDDNDDDTDII